MTERVLANFQNVPAAYSSTFSARNDGSIHVDVQCEVSVKYAKEHHNALWFRCKRLELAIVMLFENLPDLKAQRQPLPAIVDISDQQDGEIL